MLARFEKSWYCFDFNPTDAENAPASVFALVMPPVEILSEAFLRKLLASCISTLDLR
jgi:hypothetical protein